MGVKDYNALAAMLKDLHKQALTHRERSLLSRFTDELASYCKRGNIYFDKARFFEAAGYIGED